jgi:hypothetical protein
MSTIIFVATALLCLALAFVVWRYWDTLVPYNPDDEQREARLAQLNKRQANRLSDDQIRAAGSVDEAWQIMVRRGRSRLRLPRRNNKRSS